MGKENKTKGQNRTKSDTETIQLDTSQLITNAVMEYLMQSKGLKFPTQQEIADLTGLSRKTIERHYKNLRFSPSDLPQRALTPLVVNNLYGLTRKSPAAVKLWFQVIEGWNERAEETGDRIIEIKHTFLDNESSDFEA